MLVVMLNPAHLVKIERQFMKKLDTVVAVQAIDIIATKTVG